MSVFSAMQERCSFVDDSLFLCVIWYAGTQDLCSLNVQRLTVVWVL